jgi:hypothetical protein
MTSSYVIAFVIAFTIMLRCDAYSNFRMPHRLFNNEKISTSAPNLSSGLVEAKHQRRQSIFNSETRRNRVVCGLYAVGSTVAGGILSGGLHAVTGPDHLAALLPPSVGKSGKKGLKVGAIWGLGHGISATALGMMGFLLKDRIAKFTSTFKVFNKLSVVAESAVGLSLLAIGLLGVKENLEARNEISDVDGESGKSLKSNKAIFANGFLHGFSWDGAPSLAPAIAMATWRSVVCFLLSYCIGTVITMSLAAAAVGESSVRLGKAVDSPKFTNNLSLGSSGVAILVGVYWIAQALFA